jgi:hypothetical protein
MNKFNERLAAHSRRVFLNPNHSGEKRTLVFNGVTYPDVNSQLTDLELKDKKSRSAGEYVDGVFANERQLIIASDTFGEIPPLGSEIWVDDIGGVVTWAADRVGLLYVHLQLNSM